MDSNVFGLFGKWWDFALLCRFKVIPPALSDSRKSFSGSCVTSVCVALILHLARLLIHLNKAFLSERATPARREIELVNRPRVICRLFCKPHFYSSNHERGFFSWTSISCRSIYPRFLPRVFSMKMVAAGLPSFTSL